MAGEAAVERAIDLAFALPDDWESPPLSALCEFVRDGDWIETKDQGGSDLRLLQISNVGVGRFVETGNFRFITEETCRRLNCTEIEQGDVLVARMPDPTGRAWHVSNLPWRAVTAVDVAIIRTRTGELDPRFLAYVLNSPACLSLVHSLTTGTTRLRIRRADIERLRVPLPRPEEQRAIAHILGPLDDKIELNRRMSETLEAMARALFKSWFVDFDPVRAKAEGRGTGLPRELADLFPDSFVDSEIGKVPRGWVIGSILQEGDLLSGGTPKTDRPDYWDGDVLWASAKDVSQAGQAFLVMTERAISRKGLEESATQLIPAGATVVVARGATTGRMAILGREMAMNQTCYAVASKHGAPFLLYCRLRASVGELVHAAHGSVFDTITTATFRSARVVLPTPPVRAAFEGVVKPLFLRVLVAIEEAATIGNIRDALLPKLISGELRVPNAERIVAAVA